MVAFMLCELNLNFKNNVNWVFCIRSQKLHNQYLWFKIVFFSTSHNVGHYFLCPWFLRFIHITSSHTILPSSQRRLASLCQKFQIEVFVPKKKKSTFPGRSCDATHVISPCLLSHSHMLCPARGNVRRSEEQLWKFSFIHHLSVHSFWDLGAHLPIPGLVLIVGIQHTKVLSMEGWCSPLWAERNTQQTG